MSVSTWDQYLGSVYRGRYMISVLEVTIWGQCRGSIWGQYMEISI